MDKFTKRIVLFNNLLIIPICKLWEIRKKTIQKGSMKIQTDKHLFRSLWYNYATVKIIEGNGARRA